jgi:hypothetical protein
VRLDEVLDNRQTEPQSAVDAGGRSIGLPERFEDVWQEVGRHPLSGVADLDLDAVLDTFQLDMDGAAVGRELDGVRQQVGHDLLEARAVSLDESEPRIGLGGDAHVLASPAGCTARTASSTTVFKSTGVHSMRSVPAMIRETSSRSSINCACRRALS